MILLFHALSLLFFLIKSRYPSSKTEIFPTVGFPKPNGLSLRYNFTKVLLSVFLESLKKGIEPCISTVSLTIGLTLCLLKLSGSSIKGVARIALLPSRRAE